MDSETQILINTYQRKLNDTITQTVIYEARIQILSQQIQELQQQLEETPKKNTKKLDASEF